MVTSFRSPTSLYRASWRFFRQHPWQLWLSLLSIALGSAVIIAVDLANNTANQSFAQSVESLSGRMTHQLTAEQGIDEQLYARLRNEWHIRQSSPVVETEMVVAGEAYKLFGIDAFAEPMFVTDGQALSAGAFLQLLETPNAVIATKATAKRLGMSLGEPYQINIASQPKTILLVAHFPDSVSAGFDQLILTDIASAQELTGRFGKLDRIELILNEQQLAFLKEELPAPTYLKAKQNQANALQQMTAAFRTNLTAMALLAMLIGAFLVYNTMTFSVLQRRKQFAVERMLGVTGSQIFQHILVEALVLGILGSILGVILGVILGQGLLVLITRTINDLYTAIDLSVLLIQPVLIVKGVGVTLAAVLLATLAPAWEAAKVQPTLVSRRSELELRMGRMIPYLLVLGLVLLVICIGLLWLFEHSLMAGFVALFSLVIAYSLWSPLFIDWLLALLLKITASRSLLWSMAVRGIQTMRSRTNLAIIALAVAVSATVGVSIMISSFRATVAEWLELTLQSDLYVSATSEDSSRIEGLLDSFWIKQVPQLPGVKSVSTGRNVSLSINDVPTRALVLNPGERVDGGFKFRKGETADLWQRYFAGEIVLVSEPLAYHQRLDVGDVFDAINESGETLRFKVGAIYQDYSATQGMLVMSPALYKQYWQDNNLSSIGITLEEGADISSIREQLGDFAQKASQSVVIRQNKEIRDTSLMIFDRTFAITHVLRLLVVLVAFVGVFSALMALFLEKGREYAVLRATGMAPSQLNRMVLIQAAVIGVLAGLLALPLGWMMSEVLIHVINQRSFGWTLDRSFSPEILFYAVLLSLAAALLAAIYPVRRISQLSIREGLRE